MKKLVAASIVAMAAIAGSASAATTCADGNILCIKGGSAATLGAQFDPSPAVTGLANGTGVTNTTGLDGLILDGLADLSFTYLGSEAGFNNFFFQGVDLFNTGGSGSGTAVGTTASALGVAPNADGFLPFKFRSDGTIDVVNGNILSAFSSIAFKVISADANTATVIALLNDEFTGDADYDDMIIQIVAERIKGGEDVPLPAGALLLMSGLAGLGYMGRSRAAKKAV